MRRDLLLYLRRLSPTTLVDHDSDRAMGYRTFATAFGRSVAYRVGFACWIVANVGAIGLAAADAMIPRAMLPLLLIFNPLLVYEYDAFIGRAFALMYTGLWRA